MIVGVSGTTGGETPAQRATLRVLLQRSRITQVHHGEAMGIDEYAHRVIREMYQRDIRLIGHPPDDDSKRAFLDGYYEEREPAPYLVRDQHIVDEIDLLIACPSTAREILRSGTWATIRYARKAGIMIIRVNPDGSTELG